MLKRRSRPTPGVRTATTLGLVASLVVVFLGTGSAEAATPSSRRPTASEACTLAGLPVGAPEIKCIRRVLDDDFPIKGRWVPFIKLTVTGGSNLLPLPHVGFGSGVRTVGPLLAQQSEGFLVRPIPMPCPAETQNKQGNQWPYSCLAVYQDNGNHGHGVLLRQGHADPNGFGLLHAEQDHNVDELTLATTIVNNRVSLPNTRPSGGPTRRLYGMAYEVGPFNLVTVEVAEETAPSNQSGDNHQLGVLTAYCLGMTRCPDEVNASVQRSVGG